MSSRIAGGVRRLTREMTQQLKTELETNGIPSPERRSELARSMGVSIGQITKWFVRHRNDVPQNSNAAESEQMEDEPASTTNGNERPGPSGSSTSSSVLSPIATTLTRDPVLNQILVVQASSSDRPDTIRTVPAPSAPVPSLVSAPPTTQTVRPNQATSSSERPHIPSVPAVLLPVTVLPQPHPPTLGPGSLSGLVQLPTTSSPTTLGDRFATPTNFEQLRQTVQEHNAALKEIINIVEEKAAIDFHYSKMLKKLSARLHKVTADSENEIDKGWTTVAEQFDVHSTIHSNLGSALMDDIVQPLRSIQVSQQKTIRAAEILVERETRKHKEKKEDTVRVKKNLYENSKQLEKLEISAEAEKNAPTMKSPIRRQKLQEQVKKNEDVYIWETIDLEKQRRATVKNDGDGDGRGVYNQTIKNEGDGDGDGDGDADGDGRGVYNRSVKNDGDGDGDGLVIDTPVYKKLMEGVLRKGVESLEAVERQRLAHFQTALGRYQRKIEQLAPNLQQMFDRHNNNLDVAVQASAIDYITSLQPSSSAANHIILTDLYAENFGEVIATDRRRSALERVSDLLKEELNRLYNQGRADVMATNTRQITLVEFIEYLFYKVNDAMNSLDGGGCQGSHRLSRFQHKLKDKAGLPMTVLTIPLTGEDRSLPPPSVAGHIHYNTASRSSRSDEYEEYDKISDEGFYGAPSQHTANSEENKPQTTLCRALYDFEPKHEDEIRVFAGEVVVVDDRIGDDWLIGRVVSEREGADKKGRFPTSYVAF